MSLAPVHIFTNFVDVDCTGILDFKQVWRTIVYMA
jgi:hypothetical protein